MKYLYFFLFFASLVFPKDVCEKTNSRREGLNIYSYGVAENREKAKDKAFIDFKYIYDKSDDLKGKQYRIIETIADSCDNGACCVGYLYQVSGSRLKVSKTKDKTTDKFFDMKEASEKMKTGGEGFIKVDAAAMSSLMVGCMKGFDKFVEEFKIKKYNRTLIREECRRLMPKYRRINLNRTEVRGVGCGVAIGVAINSSLPRADIDEIYKTHDNLSRFIGYFCNEV